jgi:hypothetical protein
MIMIIITVTVVTITKGYSFYEQVHLIALNKEKNGNICFIYVDLSTLNPACNCNVGKSLLETDGRNADLQLHV